MFPNSTETSCWLRCCCSSRAVRGARGASRTLHPMKRDTGEENTSNSQEIRNYSVLQLLQSKSASSAKEQRMQPPLPAHPSQQGGKLCSQQTPISSSFDGAKTRGSRPRLFQTQDPTRRNQHHLPAEQGSSAAFSRKAENSFWLNYKIQYWFHNKNQDLFAALGVIVGCGNYSLSQERWNSTLLPQHTGCPPPARHTKSGLRTWKSLFLVPARVGLCRWREPGSLPPSEKVTRAGHAQRKGIVTFWGLL